MKPIHTLLLLVLSMVAIPRAVALTLYSTDFEDFAAGPDQWVGTDEWFGTSTGLGVHGIDQDLLPGLGKTAFLGFNQPDATFVTVYRPLLYDPITNATPLVEFETLFGIEDATNGYRDSFFFTIYNSGGNLLAALRLDNSELNYGIWRLDGADQTDTGLEFIRSELHLLVATIDFAANTWSADLDGIPLFEDAPFNATAQALDLGYVATEWQLGSASASEHGDNWMLIADLAVRAFPDNSAPLTVEAIGTSTEADPVLSWTGVVGFDYRVEYSDDWIAWQDDLADSLFTNVLVETPLSFTDPSGSPARVYRLQRSPAP